MQVSINFDPDERSTGVAETSGSTTNSTTIKIQAMQAALLSGPQCPLTEVKWVWVPQLDPCQNFEHRAFDGEGCPNAVQVSGFRERDVGRVQETYVFTVDDTVQPQLLDSMFNALKKQIPETFSEEDLPTRVEKLGVATTEATLEPVPTPPEEPLEELSSEMKVPLS